LPWQKPTRSQPAVILAIAAPDALKNADANKGGHTVSACASFGGSEPGTVSDDDFRLSVLI
jgi:hypothetical protein